MRSVLRTARAWAAAGLAAAAATQARGQVPVPPAELPVATQPAPQSPPAPPTSPPATTPSPPGASAAPGSSATPSNTAPAAAPAAAPKFEAKWNSGLYFETASKDFTAHVGGTVHLDFAWYTGSDAVQNFPGGVGRFGDGANMRRGRLFAEGTFYKDFDYKFEMEFFNGFSPAGLSVPAGVTTVSNLPGPTDAWVTLKNVPFLGNVRLGNQKEWLSLEHLNGYRYLEFMERSYLFDQSLTAFNNGFSPGVSAFRTWADDRVFTAVGGYKNTTSELGGYDVGDGQYAVTGRVAFLPVYCPDDHYFWHVGGAMSERDPVNGQVRLRIRDTVRNGPLPLLNLIADTGTLNADSMAIYNIETAAVCGPLTLQGEYQTVVTRGTQFGTGPNLGSVPFQGYYAEALVFLTGESRTWNPKLGIFNRVVPKRNFGYTTDCPGPGAWELGVRYTFMDLTNGGVQGGRLRNATVGLNWYLNPNLKLQWNYDYVYRDESANPYVKGAIHALGTRLAFDF